MADMTAIAKAVMWFLSKKNIELWSKIDVLILVVLADALMLFAIVLYAL